MRKILLLAISVSILFAGCTFNECSSKKMFLKSFDNFIEDIKENHSDFTKEDWKVRDEKFKKLSEECFKKFEAKLTEEERKEYFKNAVGYTFYRLKFEIPIDLGDINVDDVSRNLNILGEKAQDFSEFLEKLEKDKDFQKSLKNFEKGMERFGKGMEHLSKGLQKYMDDLEEIFDNIDDKKEN